jgi:hypothetical protein
MSEAHIWATPPDGYGTTPEGEELRFIENVQRLAQGLADVGYTDIAIEVNGRDLSTAKSLAPTAEDLTPLAQDAPAVTEEKSSAR